MGITNTKKHYCTSQVCPWWLAYFFDNPLRRLIHHPVKLLSPYLKPGMTATDIGCGMGFFTIGMARIVGDRGKVIVADLQPEMLKITIRRARKKGVNGIIKTHLCKTDSIGIDEKVDFALSFWVVHETPDPQRFLTEIKSILKPNAKFLLVEPIHHVTKNSMKRIVATARDAGFTLLETPKVVLSRAALLE